MPHDRLSIPSMGIFGVVRMEAFAHLNDNSRQGPTSVDLDKLLWRQDDGWTVLVSGDGTGIVNPWGEGWELLDEDLAVYLRTMLAALNYSNPEGIPRWPDESHHLDGGESRAPRPQFKFSDNGGNAAIRIELSPHGETVSFREKMVSSGRGRGLNAEIIKISPFDGPDSEHSVIIRSSRRPGAIRLNEKAVIPVRYADQDPFITMWPLGDLLRLE